MKDNVGLKCMFCGRGSDDENISMVIKSSQKLANGENAIICDKCINKGSIAVKKITYKFLKEDTEEYTPSKIYNRLNDYVIGQEAAKKILSVAVYNHMKRISNPDKHIKKSNILMVGPSGSGKTLLAKTLADIMNVPFVITDATSLTEAGYSGEDVENILVKLLLSSNNNLEKAQRGVVFIDEIDKLAKADRRKNEKNPTKDGVQYSLLKLIEGSNIAINLPTGNPALKKQVMFDTSNVLFICGGAFDGMLEEEKEKSIGFGADLSTENIEKDLDNDTLKQYGMQTEFIGRLPIHVQLKELTLEEMVAILTEPKNSIIKEYQELMSIDNVDLKFTEDALKEIAKTAIDNKVGARGLRSIIEDIMTDIMFNAPDDEQPREIIITKDTLKTREPVIKYIDSVEENITVYDY